LETKGNPALAQSISARERRKSKSGISGGVRGFVVRRDRIEARSRHTGEKVSGGHCGCDEATLIRVEAGAILWRGMCFGHVALGLEALERFVHKEPLRRVYECVLGVLALESQPVDSRL
jgi:hypothetical protein